MLWSKASARWSGWGLVPPASPELDLACVFSPFHSSSESQHVPSPEPNLCPWHHWLGCSNQPRPPKGCVLFGPGHCSGIRRLGTMGPYRGLLQKRTSLSIFWVLNDENSQITWEICVKMSGALIKEYGDKAALNVSVNVWILTNLGKTHRYMNASHVFQHSNYATQTKTAAHTQNDRTRFLTLQTVGNSETQALWI